MSNLSKQAGLLSLADLLRFVIKTLIGMALARLLLPAELGSYRQLQLIYATLSGIILLGFPQAMMYFLPKAIDDFERGKLIRRTLDITSLLALFCALIIFFFRGFIAKSFNNPQLSQLLFIFALSPLFLFAGSLYNFTMLGLKRPDRAALYALFSISADFILILFVAFFTRDILLITIATLASAFLQWLWAFIGLKKLSAPFSLSNFRGFAEQAGYTIPLGLSFIITILCVQLDKIMVSGFFNPEEFAVFSLGAMELPLIGVLINSVNAVLLPNLNPNQADKAAETFKASVRKNSLIIMPLAVVFYIFAPELMLFFYGSQYIDASLYFRIYLFILPLKTATYALIFQAWGQTKFIMWDSLIMLFANIVLNYILIVKLGIKGAAIATVIVSWLMLFVYLYQIKHYLKLKLSAFFPWAKMFFTLLVAIIAGLAIYPFVHFISLPFVRMIVFGSLYLLIYATFAYLCHLILPYDLNTGLEFAKNLIAKVKR